MFFDDVHVVIRTNGAGAGDIVSHSCRRPSGQYHYLARALAFKDVSILPSFLPMPGSKNRPKVSACGSQPLPETCHWRDEMTIYLWAGKPVAYLQESSNTFHINGFNGGDFGWLMDGVILNHEGDASCAAKERTSSPKTEPHKGH